MVYLKEFLLAFLSMPYLHSMDQFNENMFKNVKKFSDYYPVKDKAELINKMYRELLIKGIPASNIEINIIKHITTIDENSRAKFNNSFDTISHVILILQSYNVPKELIYQTLSKLPLFKEINAGLLYNSGLKKNHLLAHTKANIKKTNELLKKPLRKMHFLHLIYKRNSTEVEIEVIKPLVYGTTLRKDWYELETATQHYPEKMSSLLYNNLAYKIYTNYARITL